jgi:diaminopimelate epimerase
MSKKHSIIWVANVKKKKYQIVIPKTINQTIFKQKKNVGYISRLLWQRGNMPFQGWKPHKNSDARHVEPKDQ